MVSNIQINHLKSSGETTLFIYLTILITELELVQLIIQVF